MPWRRSTRSFYFRPRKIGELAGEMLRSWDMTKRRLARGSGVFPLPARARGLRGPRIGSLKFLIVTADDFGLHER